MPWIRTFAMDSVIDLAQLFDSNSETSVSAGEPESAPSVWSQPELHDASLDDTKDNLPATSDVGVCSLDESSQTLDEFSQTVSLARECVHKRRRRFRISECPVDVPSARWRYLAVSDADTTTNADTTTDSL